MCWYTKWCRCARRLVFSCDIIYNIKRHCPAPSGFIILGLFSCSVFALIKFLKPLGFLCVRCLTAVADPVIFDATVIAATYEWFSGYFTAGFLEIVIRVQNVVVVLLLGTGALVLGALMLVPVGVRTVVPVRDILLLPDGQLSLELFIDKRNIFFEFAIFGIEGRVR